MNRFCTDARVWLPIACAAVCFALRLRAPAVPGLAPAPRVVTLPTIHGAPAAKGDVAYVLDPERSTVRFLAQTGNGDLLFACRTVSGTLRLCSNEVDSELQLRLDLASLVPVGEGSTPIDLQRLLGVHSSSEIVYRATLQRSSTSIVPAVTEHIWIGTLRVGSRRKRQPMQLWQSALPGQPLRLQGHGTVDITEYGLPRRTWLGLAEEHHVVTLGLDLAWRRARPR